MISIEDKDFQLSIANLDEACLQLPASYSHWYDKEAKAKSKRDDLKDKIDTEKAEAELYYRSLSLVELNKITNQRLKSLTEAVYKAVVLTDSKVIKAIDAYHVANRDFNVSNAKRRSLEQVAELADLLGRLWMKGLLYDGVIKETTGLANRVVRSKADDTIRKGKNWPQSKIERIRKEK